MRPIVAYLTFALAIAFALSPFFVSSFNGFDPNQFPNPQNDPPVQPAGYAFSIWGLIYIWLILSMGFGALRRADNEPWHRMRVPLTLSLIVGTVWLAAANASPILATVLIWVMLFAALGALFRAPQTDPWLARFPLGLNAGWLSAASCVSLGLLAAGYAGVDQTYAALGTILIALILASTVQTRLRQTPTYGIAVIWALLGVVVANLASTPTVAALAFGGAVALAWQTYKSSIS